MDGVAFLVVNYRTAEHVIALVRSIQKWLGDRTYEILVCDNSADPRELKLLGSIIGERVRVFVSPRNIGFVRAVNALSVRTTCQTLVLLNPDTLFVDGSFGRLLDYVERTEGVGAVGPALLNEDGSRQTAHYRFPTLSGVMVEHLLLAYRDPYAYRESPKEPFECDVIKGACLAVRRSALTGPNVLDERFVMYSEDVDLCRHLQRAGFHNMFYPNARVIHLGERSARQESVNLYSLWHYHRSRVLYFRKYSSRLTALLVHAVLILSLVEKTAGLLVKGKRRSSKEHLIVLGRMLRWSSLRDEDSMEKQLRVGSVDLVEYSADMGTQ